MQSTAWSESFCMHSMLGFPTSLFSSQRCSPRAFFFFCGPRAAERVITRPRRPCIIFVFSFVADDCQSQARWLPLSSRRQQSKFENCSAAKHFECCEKRVQGLCGKLHGCANFPPCIFGVVVKCQVALNCSLPGVDWRQCGTMDHCWNGRISSAFSCGILR